MNDQLNAPLSVVRLIATKKGDPPTERGPAIWMRSEDARYRLLMDGELVWVHGPRRHELATVFLDDALARGTVVLRDIAGASPSEIVKVVKVDTDTPRAPRRGNLA